MPGAGQEDVSVELLHAFGSQCSTGLKDPAFFADDAGHYLLHPAGRHIVLRHIETSESQFLVSGPKVEAITACCISRDRSYLAACEKVTGSPNGQVTVYDLVIHPPKIKKKFEPGVGRLAAAAFSPESPARYLAFIAIGAETVVFITEWQTDRVIGRLVMGCPIEKIAFAPHDSNQLSVCGPHTLKLPRLRDCKTNQGGKPLPSLSGIDESAVTFTDHAWIEPGDGTLVACTKEGPVYILSSQEMRVIGQPIASPFQDTEGLSDTVPYAIRCFSQGFVVGGSEGMVAVWERVDNGPVNPGQKQAMATEFKHVRTVRARQTDSAVCCLDMPTTEESLIVSFRNNDIGYISMASLYMSRPGEMDCMVFSGGFHNGPVAGLDIAAQRPLIVSTCRKDSSLRIWNYATRQCDLRWEFAGDPPSCVAIHPFGYFIAVSFGDKMRIYQVLVSELKLQKDFMLQRIQVLRFSNGGHFFAAAQGKNVHVFSVRTFSKIKTLSGHQLHVKALSFDPDDNLLFTCGDDGVICEWDTTTWEKVHDHKTKSQQYLAVSCSPSGDTFCSTTDGSFSFLRRFRHVDCPEQQFDVPGRGFKLQALCHSVGGPDTFNTQTMFAGTSTGALWIWPSPVQQPEKHVEVGLHVGSCNFTCISSDSKTLATAGDDGTIFVLGVSGLTAVEDARTEKDIKVAESEVVLMNRSEIQQQQDEFQLLQAENIVLKQKLEDERTKLEVECQKRVDEARQRDQAEIAELSRRGASLQKATTAKEKESSRVRGQMEETHNEAKTQLEHLYEKKLEHESDRLVMLKAEQLRLEGVIKSLRKQTDVQLDAEREKAEEELERQLMQKDLEIQKHKDLIAFSQRRFERLLQDEGQVHDHEVADMKVTAHEELEEFKRAEVQLRVEQETLWKGLHEMEKDMDGVEREQHESKVQISGMEGLGVELTRTLKSLEAEKVEREATLEDKSQKIETYQKKVKDLKKFRHILNKELKDVAESLQPKDHMIKTLQTHLNEFEREFETMLKDQRDKEEIMNQKKQQITFLDKEKKKLKVKRGEIDNIIARYTNDLHNLVTNPDVEKKDWPAEIRRIYHVYVCGQNVREEQLPIDIIQSKMRQMEGKVATLNNKGSQMEATCKKDIQRKSQENATLVHDLNLLRVQNKSLQGKVKTLELKLKSVEQGATGSIEDMTRPAQAPAPPLPGTGVPRIPSDGSLPGPRQRAQSPLDDGTQLGTRPQKLMTEHEKRMQSLQLTADVNGQQLQVQLDESKHLRQKLDHLLQSGVPPEATLAAPQAHLGDENAGTTSSSQLLPEIASAP